jgi:hypothetical protein
VPGADPADAMAQINAIESARPLHGPVMHSKSNGIPLCQRYHFRPRLHSRPLLGQYKFATGEIAAWFRQQDRDLQRKHVLAVDILMQAIVILSPVLQQQRRRPGLAGDMASLQKCLMALRITDVDAHGLVPAIGDIAKLRIERRSHFCDQWRKRIGKIFVLAASEAVTPHHHSTAEMSVVRIECCEPAALVPRQQSLQDRATLRIEIVGCLRPVDGLDARRNAGWGRGTDEVCV